MYLFRTSVRLQNMPSELLTVSCLYTVSPSEFQDKSLEYFRNYFFRVSVFFAKTFEVEKCKFLTANLCSFKSCGIWRCVGWQRVIDVSKDHKILIFSVEQSKKSPSFKISSADERLSLNEAVSTVCTVGGYSRSFRCGYSLNFPLRTVDNNRQAVRPLMPQARICFIASITLGMLLSLGLRDVVWMRIWMYLVYTGWSCYRGRPTTTRTPPSFASITYIT